MSIEKKKTKSTMSQIIVTIWVVQKAPVQFKFREQTLIHVKRTGTIFAIAKFQLHKDNS